jgi:hypothetical protein
MDWFDTYCNRQYWDIISETTHHRLLLFALRICKNKNGFTISSLGDDPNVGNNKFVVDGMHAHLVANNFKLEIWCGSRQ